MTERQPRVEFSKLEGTPFPVIGPVGSWSTVVGWFRTHSEELTDLLHHYGAVLLRGWSINSAAQFREIVEASWAAPWADYREPGTPRKEVTRHIATSTEYDSETNIPFHNENSHVTSWPSRLSFWCEQPAAQGGSTPLSDVRDVLHRLPDSIRTQAQSGIIYQRTFGYGLGFSWQEVFGTIDPAHAEEYFKRNGIRWTWDGPRLRVRYHRPALRIHPATKSEVWFNHALIYNPYALPAEQQPLLDQFGFDQMPFATFWGNGERVGPAEVSDIQQAYDNSSHEFGWQRGDLLMIDNMLTAHGRRAYRGARRVLVAMRGIEGSEQSPRSLGRPPSPSGARRRVAGKTQP